MYTNESSIPEEIARRLDALKTTTEMENYYETDTDHDLDAFEQDGYEQLIHDTANEEFQVDLDGDEEIEKGVVLNEEYLKKHFKEIGDMLSIFSAYPDIFLDFITPSDSNF